MVELGVNIDHVATLRQARRTYEPDPVWAAVEAELGGADGITVHLREDRRHINDRDVQVLRQTVQCKLNLEMSIVPEIVEIAAADRAGSGDARAGTPGGSDHRRRAGSARVRRDRIDGVVSGLKRRGIFVSAFLDPDEEQIKLAPDLVLTPWSCTPARMPTPTPRRSRATRPARTRRRDGSAKRGMRLHAGHGLNYRNVGPIAESPR